MGETEESSENMEEATEVAEEEIEDEYANLPEGMYIPNPEDAQLPELTHFDYKYYMEPARVYTEKEIEVLWEKAEAEYEVMSISSWDVSEYLKCCFQIVADEDYHYIRGDAYKQKSSNLYIGDLLSYQDAVIGKFIISYKGEKIVISIQYYDQNRDWENGALLTEGVHYYDYFTILLEERAIEKAGKPVVAEDYSSYSGKWFKEFLGSNQRFEDTYMELSIQKDKMAGILHFEGADDNHPHTEFSGFIENSIGMAEYADDGYGHSGSLTFTFCETGIILYLNEHGKPNFYGFPTGNNYYFQ